MTIPLLIAVLLFLILGGALGTTRTYVPGPIEIWTDAGTPATMLFLGRSESGVTTDWQRYFTPIMSDLAGPEEPFDVQHMGMSCVMRFNLTVFDWAQVTLAKKLRAATEGVIAAGVIGTPIMAGALDMRTLLFFPNGGVALYTGIPTARNFPHSWIVNDPETLGTKAASLPIVIQAYRLKSTVDGSGTLYDSSTTGKGTAA